MMDIIVNSLKAKGSVARVAELVDALDLGSSGPYLGRGSSSLPSRMVF